MFEKPYNHLLRYCKHSLVLLVISLVAFACVSSDDEARFNSSMAMAQNGQKEEAYKNISDLCMKFPDDKRFCTEASVLKGEIYSENIKLVQEKLDSEKPVSLSDLTFSSEKLEIAQKYAETDEEINKYKDSITNYTKQTNDAISTAKSSAEKSAADADFFSAFVAVKSVKRLSPADIGPLVDKYAEQTLASGIPVIEGLIAEDNLKEAKAIIAKLLQVDPQNTKVKEFEAVVNQNDNADYYIVKGDEADAAEKLELALAYYKKALEFPESRVKAQELVDGIRVKMIDVSFMKGVEASAQELNKQAYDQFMTAFEMMKKLPQNLIAMVNVPKKDLEQYYDNLYYLTQKTMDDGLLGQAYLYSHMLFDLAPTYHGVRQIKKQVEDKALDRALKKVAVTNFTSPASEPQLGVQVSTNIIQILQKELSSDIKLTERGAIDMLLREYELSVAGGSQTAGQTGASEFKLASANYIITGEVLDSRTETNIQDSKKRVRVQVSEDKIRNIEWEDWNKDYASARGQGLETPPEPPKYIMKPNFESVEYDVKTYEKISYLSVSYRVVDPSTGTVLYSNTVRAQKEARDEATGGIDYGTFKVVRKIANLPTDIELSNDVRKEAINKITAQVKEMFTNQDVKYLEIAVNSENTNNARDAVENYVNAIVIMTKKGKDLDGFEAKAGKYLDYLAQY